MQTLLIPVEIQKLTEKDTFGEGCDPKSTKVTTIPLPKVNKEEDWLGESIVDLMSFVVGRPVLAEEVFTCDPNLYCDIKSPPGYRVVDNRTARGLYRVGYERLENRRGQPPTAAEMNDFKAGRISLISARYEIHFQLKLVGMSPEELGAFLKINYT